MYLIYLINIFKMWNVVIAGTIIFIILWLVAYYFINDYIQKNVNDNQKLKDEYKM